ncbi:MAG: SMC family ATPase, partial [Chryseobacterium sp.]|nr:SMC family ATPase [Candidatus Chryseobacterium enterohippi]
MIPIQLTIQGLYSYQEKQTIDFKNLTDSGLFGIFGSVGSGKSSILEAISFALYGETERLNLRDKRAYNMMNLKSNTSLIEFDFVNYENKTYRATREFKRNPKKFDDVKPVSTTFYESINNQWIPLDHTDVKKINGNLSYENFKRTIIIPQGQFKEFLELGAKERTDMMQEIFKLQRFDLYRNATSLNTKNRSELDQLEGQLKGFEMISEEEISTKKETLEVETKNHDALKIVFKQISEKYQQLKNLKGDFEMLTQKKEEFLGLKNQKANIDTLENKTEVYDRIFRIFKPLLNEKQKNSLEVSKQQNDKNILVKKLEETEEKFNVLKKQIQELLPKYEALTQTKIEENDWSLILQIKALSDEILTLKIRTEKGSEKVEEVIALQNKSKEETAKYSKDLEVLKSKKLDSTLLTEVGNWFSVQKNLEESSFNLNKKIAEIKNEILKIEDELLPYNVDIKSFREEFSDKIENLDIKKGEFSGKKNQLEVQKQLSHYADALHDGESCPLCGALEHPN